MVDVPISKLSAAGSLTGEELAIISQLSTTVKITGTTLSAQASDNSFNDSANGFIAAGFAVNNYVHVVGFTGNVVNNIYSAKITALTAGKMTIGGTDGDVIVDDAAGESVTITKWVSRRTPLPTGTDGGVVHLAYVTPDAGGPAAASYAGRALNTTVSNTISGATAIPSSTFTVTIASPGVVTWNAHGLSAGTPVVFTSTGALPTGLAVNTVYYVLAPTTNTFTLSATSGGSAINTSGSQSGTHTAKAGEFTLPAGTFDIDAACNCWFSGNSGFRSRLYNLTDAVEQSNTVGSSHWAGVSSDRVTTVRGRFTISGTKTFRLETICTGAVATSGHGADTGLGVDNLFTNCIIKKVA